MMQENVALCSVVVILNDAVLALKKEPNIKLKSL